MSQARSPSQDRRYGLVRTCTASRTPRSTVYALRHRRALPPRPPRRPGPRCRLTDAELLERIREVLRESPFHGEGYRKAWARLRLKGVPCSRHRVLRVMREAGILAPTRSGRPHGPAAHDGTITTARPDEMWGIDATAAVTLEEGTATIFVAVDHGTTECVGIHASRVGTRFEAMEPMRQGVRERFGVYAEGAAEGLAVRHDHGSVFVSRHFQGELRFLGARSSPAFVREPEGNGCVERFIRTLKEQLLWVRTFRTIEELRLALHAFKHLYNSSWLVQRHGFLTPAQAREKLLAAQEVAA